MILQIQSNIECENCIKCGSRPQIEQSKKFWIVTCPNKKCNNFVKAEFINMDSWNRLNKSNTNLTQKQPLKQTA
jgi:hypothetical protein